MELSGSVDGACTSGLIRRALKRAVYLLLLRAARQQVLWFEQTQAHMDCMVDNTIDTADSDAFNEAKADIATQVVGNK